MAQLNAIKKIYLSRDNSNGIECYNFSTKPYKTVYLYTRWKTTRAQYRGDKSRIRHIIRRMGLFSLNAGDESNVVYSGGVKYDLIGGDL